MTELTVTLPDELAQKVKVQIIDTFIERGKLKQRISTQET